MIADTPTDIDDEAFDTVEEEIATRFLLELFEAAGDTGLTEDEIERASDKFQDMRINHAICELWLDNRLACSYSHEADDLAFTMTAVGRAEAASMGLLPA